MDFISTEMTDDDRGSTTVAVLPPVGSMVRVTTSLEPLQRCRATVMTVDDEKQSDKGPTFDLLIEEDVETELSEVGSRAMNSVVYVRVWGCDVEQISPLNKIKKKIKKKLDLIMMPLRWYTLVLLELMMSRVGAFFYL